MNDSLVISFIGNKSGYISRGLAIFILGEQEPIDIIFEGVVSD
jgi:hypothetical protein